MVNVDGMHGGMDVRYGVVYHEIGAGGARFQEGGMAVVEAGGGILTRYAAMVRQGGGVLTNRL